MANRKVTKIKRATQTSESNMRVTNKKLALFLDHLTVCGSVNRSAAEAKLHRTTLYRKKERDPVFAAAWDKAAALGVEALEDEARRRAFEGWQEPVFHKGQVCGGVQKYSDTLLIVLLKAHKPEKYRENSKTEVVGPGGGPLQTLTEIALSPALQSLIDKAAGRELSE
jgi:hypothetical protein